MREAKMLKGENGFHGVSLTEKKAGCSLNKISEYEDEIRKFINKSRKQHLLMSDSAKWNKLCASLDVIGDTEFAVDAFINLQDDDYGYGKRYLIVYGLLQILYVQQDALRDIYDCLNMDYEGTEELARIRKIRNASIGHPTSALRGKSFNFIQRMTLHQGGFRMMSTYADDEEIEFYDVNLIDLVAIQKNEIEILMERVVIALRDEDMEHKKKFKDVKLLKIFSPTLGYYFAKVREAFSGSAPKEYGATHFNYIVEIIEAFKKELIDRGGDYGTEQVSYLNEEIEYPVREIIDHLDGKDNLNNQAAYIFLFYVESKVQEMKDMAKEIDEDYESK